MLPKEEFANREGDAPVPVIIGDGVWPVWKEDETYNFPIGGTWKYIPGSHQLEAKWNNNATATLTLLQFTKSRIVVSRKDGKDSSSPGLTAKYTSQRTGNKVTGRVWWKWNEREWDGSWNAELMIEEPSAKPQEDR
ncbi:MAG: hypothetical protein LC130_01385 [Bryobacterales bacterium]|nr:hypothetical protein [Bryobacterales bacterium]